MTTRMLRARVPGTFDVLLARLRDQEAIPAYADDIVSVEPVGEQASRWILEFRGGTATWTQRERVNGNRFEFQQIDGDFMYLHGAWTVDDGEVRYDVEYGTSVAHLAGALDPMIGRVLLRAAKSVLIGIAGEIEVLDGEDLLRDWGVDHAIR